MKQLEHRITEQFGLRFREPWDYSNGYVTCDLDVDDSRTIEGAVMLTADDVRRCASERGIIEGDDFAINVQTIKSLEAVHVTLCAPLDFVAYLLTPEVLSHGHMTGDELAMDDATIAAVLDSHDVEVADALDWPIFCSSEMKAAADRIRRLDLGYSFSFEALRAIGKAKWESDFDFEIFCYEVLLADPVNLNPPAWIEWCEHERIRQAMQSMMDELTSPEEVKYQMEQRVAVLAETAQRVRF